MAQKDFEKFQTPATAFRGENGPGGPKTPDPAILGRLGAIRGVWVEPCGC